MARKPPLGPAKDTRGAVVDLLKHQGPMDAKALASRLGLTIMAVRLHLYALRDEQVVEGVAEHRPLGRPATMWRLTPAANRFFPDRHAELAASSFANVERVFGPEGLSRFLQAVAQYKAEEYRPRVPKRASLKRRVECLADLRTREGYMAEVEEREDGSLLLVENHCPICRAASTQTQLCSVEIDMLRQVLGPNAEVQRVEHIQAGARRCAYLVEQDGDQSTHEAE